MFTGPSVITNVGSSPIYTLYGFKPNLKQEILATIIIDTSNKTVIILINIIN